jgi:hypothetical protein
MTQQESDVSPATQRDTSALRRAANLAAHLVGGAGLAFGAVSALAKRRKKSADGDSDGNREARREDRRDARRAEREDDGKADKWEARQERRESRDEDHGRDHHARNGSVDQEQKSNRKKDDEPNNNDGSDDSSNDDGGDNGRGNAGSGFFDSPLARKTQRRAKDFDDNRDRDDEPEDDRLTGNSDGDGHQFETNSISFSNGPDGLEVITRNIEYSAPPTPTPTPFPTLTLPERDRLDVFGDRVIAAPTAVPSDDDASDGSAPPPSTDTGNNASTGSRPSPTPASGDTSGGDNTSDFLS